MTSCPAFAPPAGMPYASSARCLTGALASAQPRPIWHQSRSHAAADAAWRPPALVVAGADQPVRLHR